MEKGGWFDVGAQKLGIFLLVSREYKNLLTIGNNYGGGVISDHVPVRCVLHFFGYFVSCRDSNLVTRCVEQGDSVCSAISLCEGKEKAG